jgi:hypothetical protein
MDQNRMVIVIAVLVIAIIVIAAIAYVYHAGDAEYKYSSVSVPSTIGC